MMFRALWIWRRWIGVWRPKLRRIGSKHGHTDGHCGSSQFLIERGEWQRSSPGKLEVGGIVDREVEVICEIQRNPLGVSGRRASRQYDRHICSAAKGLAGKNV